MPSARHIVNARSPLRWSWTFCLWVMLIPALGLGQETGITRKHHPWGRFEAGAWKRVQVVTETFDDERTLTSTAETKTTLQEIADDGVTLLIESVVEVGGKRIQAEPQTVKQSWHGEPANQDVKISHLGDGEVVIQNRKIPCKIQQLELTGPASKTTTKIYYSDTFEPFILRRETVKKDAEGNTQFGETTAEVVGVDVPCRILANVRKTFDVEVVHKHTKGTTTTSAVTSMLVPGGVIYQTSKEYDGEGRLIRRSTLKLLEYGLETSKQPAGLFRRMRPGPFRRFYRLSPRRSPEPSPDQD